jgi:hypothetical protein
VGVVTDSIPCEVIPYARFLVYQEQRRRIAGDPTERVRPVGVDPIDVIIPAKTALPTDAEP